MDSDTELQSKKKKSKNKRKSIAEPEPLQVKVQVIRENPHKTSPFIGYFPSGFDPSNYSGSTSFQVHRNQNMTQRLQLVVKPAGAPVDFVGTNYSGEAIAGSRARYALGVFDKDAQTLKILPIASNKIFRLDPKMKGLEAVNREPAISTMKELTFATKKAIEKAKKRQALRQDEEPDSQKNLELKMENVLVNEKALESTESHVTRNIPPYCLCFQDESEKKKLSCIFSYINHLIKFKDQHSMDGASSSKNHRILNILRHKFTTMFDVSDTKRLPEEKIHLLDSYVLVLTLFTDDFQTDYKDIRKDLRMNPQDVQGLYEHLGCKIKRPESEDTGKRYNCATLPVPLQFP